jgi:arylsulfatase A-like enzyme
MKESQKFVPVRRLLFSLCTLCSLWLPSLTQAVDKPNILFVLTDDQRWDSLGCAGHPFLKTPNIDRIAKEGAYFKNAFVTLPLCSPSRASFLTGKYAHTHGIKGNGNDGGPISHQLDTYPMHLQKAGYETAAIGKLHMGNDDSPRPGFDRWVIFKGQGRYKDCPFNVDGKPTPREGYVTDVITDYAVDFIKKDHGGKPFAMYVGHKAVHGPFTPAERHKDMYKDEPLPQRPNVQDDLKGKPALTRKVSDPPKDHPAYGVNEALIRNQLRCILAVDDSVGKMLDALKEIGQLDNTIVVFTSDNGYFWNEHRLGDKRAAYEESIRVPLVMRYPALIKPGTQIEQMVLNVDLAPTFIELGGAEAIAGAHGRSILPLLAGDAKDWRTSALFEYFLEKMYPNMETYNCVRTDRWKYIQYTDLKEMDELYDLQNDPYEMKNLINDSAHAADVEKLKAELEKVRAEAK